MSVDLIILSEARLYREGIAFTLESRSRGITVVGACADVNSALELMRHHPRAVALLDVSHADVERAVPRFREVGVRMVALAMNPSSDNDIVAALESGFSGLVSAEDSVEDLADTVTQAARGELECSPRATAVLARRLADLARGGPSPAATQNLTAREKEVAELLECGFSNKQIARELSIRLATVKNHVHNILSKLGVERRGEAAAALRGGLTQMLY